jgi:formate hydrogenlyase subunit 6/NADH:ubiquinone oxidoreductase subunit I
VPQKVHRPLSTTSVNPVTFKDNEIPLTVLELLEKSTPNYKCNGTTNKRSMQEKVSFANVIQIIGITDFPIVKRGDTGDTYKFTRDYNCLFCRICYNSCPITNFPAEEIEEGERRAKNSEFTTDTILCVQQIRTFWERLKMEEESPPY